MSGAPVITALEFCKCSNSRLQNSAKRRRRVRARPIFEKVLGPDHPDMAITLSDVGVLYQAVGDYVKAGELRQRSLRARALAPQRPAVQL